MNPVDMSLSPLIHRLANEAPYLEWCYRNQLFKPSEKQDCARNMIKTRTASTYNKLGYTGPIFWDLMLNKTDIVPGSTFKENLQRQLDSSEGLTYIT